MDMRPSCVGAVLITTVLSAGSGCHQRPAPIAGAPTTPIGPLAPAAPNAGAVGPSLGPFGAPTRVPPPATGSYSTPNNYLGGAAPGGQAFSPNPRAPSFASAPSRLQPLGAPAAAAPLPSTGSGVRQTGWTDTAHAATGASSAPPFPADDPAHPRLGGLPVNDLTGAPPPPGYYRSSPAPVAGGGYAGGAPRFRGYRQPSAATGSTFAAPTGQSLAPVGAAPAAVSVDGAASAPAPVSAPSLPQWRGEDPSTAQARAAAQQHPGAAPPSTKPAPSAEPAPSTEPTARSAAEDDSDLPWRRPGSQY